MALLQDFRVRKGLFVSENTIVTGNVAVQQQLTVTNTATFSNTVAVTGNATFSNNLTTTGFANVGGTLQVAGIATFGTSNAIFDTDTLVVDSFNDRVSVNAASATVAFFVQGDANVAGTFTANNINFTNIVGTSLTIGTGNSQFDSGVLFIDAFNNRVGINNTTPDASLSVTGTANVSSTMRVGGTFTAVLASFFSNTVSVTGNATFSNVVSITGDTTLSSALNVTGLTTTAAINATAITATSVTSSGGVSLTGGVFLGNLNGVANQCARSILNGSFILGGAALTGDVTLSVDASTTNVGNKVVARDVSGNFAAGTITASLAGTATNANTLLYAGGYRIADALANATTIMARDAAGSTSVNILTGTATTARYADLAEKYLADKVYEPGIVVCVGGEKEITAATSNTGHSVIGVVSRSPAYLMNSNLANGTIVALKGRVPVYVTGPVQKGDRLAASAFPGIAIANNNKDAWSFAIALKTDVDNETRLGDNKARLVEALIL